MLRQRWIAAFPTVFYVDITNFLIPNHSPAINSTLPIARKNVVFFQFLDQWGNLSGRVANKARQFIRRQRSPVHRYVSNGRRPGG
jgi:hypothetical protein